MSNYINKMVSFVIPCYNSQNSIPIVVDEIRELFKSQDKYSYEIILVNDHSKDDTFSVIKGLATEDKNIVAIDFSRNFGQASAIMAGMSAIHGEFMFSLDDDGQMPIESIFVLIDKLEEGYDIAFGKYEEVKQKWYRNIGSYVNNKMCRIFLEQPKDIAMSSFWVARRFIIDEVIEYNGPYPYIGGLLLRISRNMVNVPVKERDRISGESGYSFKKLIGLWFNGFTAFSVKPLRFATIVGIVSACIGFIYSIVMVVRKIIYPDILLGYASIVTLILVIGGMIMMLLGMIGEYLGRIYISINKAPQYVIKEVVDNRNKEEGV